MTPFGEYIKQLRISRGLQQNQIALAVGISPCYYSAIESGSKPPPSRNVFNNIVDELKLAQKEVEEINAAAVASKRTYTVPKNLTVHEQRLVGCLWERLGSITSDQAQCIETILKIKTRS